MLGFWGAMAVLTLLRRSVDGRGPDGLSPEEIIITVIEFGLWAILTPFIFWLLNRFPFEKKNWLARVALHIAAAFFAAALVEVIDTVAFGQLFAPPDGSPRARPWRFDPVHSILHFHFLDEVIVYAAILATTFARQYFLKYRERREAATLLEAQLTEARLDALRMQLNPHFLFNTLHAVSALVERDPAGVRRIIARLSDLLRHSLDGDAQEVTLRDELQVLNSYLDIQQVRFQDNLDIEVDVPLEFQDALVPNLILQPLAENAIQHGISKLVDTRGRLLISADRQANQLVVEVIDNGAGIDTSYSESRGVGLRNTRARLDALYGVEASVTLENQDAGGCIARVRLPYHERPLNKK